MKTDSISSIFILFRSLYSNKHFRSPEGHSRNRDLTSHQSALVCMDVCHPTIHRALFTSSSAETGILLMLRCGENMNLCRTHCVVFRNLFVEPLSLCFISRNTISEYKSASRFKILIYGPWISLFSNFKHFDKFAGKPQKINTRYPSNVSSIESSTDLTIFSYVDNLHT